MAIRSASSLVFLMMVIGCAGHPVAVGLQQNQPYDPGAPESRFTLPSDPFDTEMTMAHPQAHEKSESAAGRRLTRGDLLESPAVQSATPDGEKVTGDRTSTDMPHRHHMERGQ